MPCYDPETHDRPIRLEKNVHLLTSMLCQLCGKMETTNPALIEENPELAKWWANHKEHDRRYTMLRDKRDHFGWEALTKEEIRIVALGDDVSY